MEEMEIVRSAQISGLHLFLDSLAYRTPHMHREFELLWVLRGALTAKGEGFDCTAGPGGLLLFNPCQTHECRRAGMSVPLHAAGPGTGADRLPRRRQAAAEPDEPGLPAGTGDRRPRQGRAAGGHPGLPAPPGGV